MRTNRQRLLWLGISIFGALTVAPALLAQASPDSEATFPVTTDWSNHHVIYSRPASAEQAERLRQDPRYLRQISRYSDVLLPEATPEVQLIPDTSLLEENQKSKGLWEEDLGSGGTVGATSYPAKYSFKTNVASCANDFVVYATESAQASIVAYNNLYSGCGGTVPSVYWAYETGAPINTSPIFSRDGTQVAFVQTNSLGHGILVLVKWAASTGESITSPGTITRVSNALYPACVAPCMTTLVLPAGSTGTLDSDTNSSVFYDYPGDTLYVGDDAGYLHQFHPFFLGVPTEIGGAWPVQVNPGSPSPLNEPVHDFVSGNVFVADNSGFLYRVDPAGAVTASGQLDFSVSEDGGPGIVQGPVIDPSAGLIYVFATSDGSGACPITIGGSDCSAVYQLTTSFTAGDTGTEALVGTSSQAPTAPEPMYIGGFDIAYENSTDPPTGNLYVCGNTGGTPVLYQVLITGGAFGTVNPGPDLSATVTTPCSPVADVYNPNASGGATEWIFASVEADGPSSACLGVTGHGCIFNFKDTQWKASTSYSVGQEVIDTHFQIQVVIHAGTSGSVSPSWQTIPGKITNDPSATAVRWIDQGVQSASPSAWLAGHLYVKGIRILDANNNVQLVTTAGTSGSPNPPSFNTTPGLTTHDGAGTLVWTNVGAYTSNALAASGGTSGLIIDNTVTTPAGASQVYFSTLGNQACGTSGTGACAVQASQSGLQ